MLEIKFLALKFPLIRYFKIEHLCWNFWENRPVDLKSFIGEFFWRQIRVRVVKNHREWLMFKNVENFCAFWPHSSKAFRKQRSNLFFENTRSAYLKTLFAYFRRVRTSWGDWEQNPKIGKVWRWFCDPYFWNDQIRLKNVWKLVKGKWVKIENFGVRL